MMIPIGQEFCRPPTLSPQGSWVRTICRRRTYQPRLASLTPYVLKNTSIGGFLLIVLYFVKLGQKRASVVNLPAPGGLTRMPEYRPIAYNNVIRVDELYTVHYFHFEPGHIPTQNLMTSVN